MKILLVAVNAKYIHSNLAVYSLRAYAKEHAKMAAAEVEIAEYTINQQMDVILRDIFLRKPDVVCFSCYIWNRLYIETIVRELPKILPGTEIWLGGPEVSYDAAEVLGRLPQVKGVMKGEGEETFAQLCRVYAACGERGEESGDAAGKERMDGGKKRCREMDCQFSKTLGITYRASDGEIRENPWREPLPLDLVPFVYEDMSEFENRIIYYETSRGCPFSCSYCLSSVDKKLRFRSLHLVEKELQFFIDHKVLQVKFVDRTFNCNHRHAAAIWKYIAEHDNGVTNFHFEVSADLLNEGELELIRGMRPGLIQLEIGVQSTNPETVREIRRTMDLEKVRENVGRIRESGNVHQHLDLIAGLPFEDLERFVRSFDEVYGMKPQMLQLGFLKVLKGSYMEENRKEYGLVAGDEPPYEVLYTKWLSYENVLELKGVEEMVEVYYNSGQFSHSMERLEEEYSSSYRMYRDLWEHYEKKGLIGVQHKRSARYEILLDFVKIHFPQKAELMREVLIYDYYLRENAKTRPEFAGEYTVDSRFLRAFYEREEKERTYLPEYREYDRKQMRKMTHIEHFPLMNKTVVFSYKQRNSLNQEARTCMIKEVL